MRRFCSFRNRSCQVSLKWARASPALRFANSSGLPPPAIHWPCQLVAKQRTMCQVERTIWSEVGMVHAIDRGEPGRQAAVSRREIKCHRSPEPPFPEKPQTRGRKISCRYLPVTRGSADVMVQSPLSESKLGTLAIEQIPCATANLSASGQNDHILYDSQWFTAHIFHGFGRSCRYFRAMGSTRIIMISCSEFPS